MATSSAPGAAPFVPEQRTLPVLQQAVQKCHGCDLYRNATQAVFGELETGPKSAKTRVSLMMIGEQPGDQEDKQGRPFVGPAGKLLDQCLEEAGIVRSSVYVTNTVKHFKWEPRGKLRIHKKPGMQEIRACRPWLQAELETVRPKLIVCLGAVAAQSLLGSKFKITESHRTAPASRRPSGDHRHPPSLCHPESPNRRRPSSPTEDPGPRSTTSCRSPETLIALPETGLNKSICITKPT